MTLDAAVVQVNGCFDAGMAYVSSRACARSAAFASKHCRQSLDCRGCAACACSVTPRRARPCRRAHVLPPRARARRRRTRRRRPDRERGAPLPPRRRCQAALPGRIRHRGPRGLARAANRRAPAPPPAREPAPRKGAGAQPGERGEAATGRARRLRASRGGGPSRPRARERRDARGRALRHKVPCRQGWLGCVRCAYCKRRIGVRTWRPHCAFLRMLLCQGLLTYAL